MFSTSRGVWCAIRAAQVVFRRRGRGIDRPVATGDEGARVPRGYRRDRHWWSRVSMLAQAQCCHRYDEHTDHPANKYVTYINNAVAYSIKYYTKSLNIKEFMGTTLK